MELFSHMENWQNLENPVSEKEDMLEDMNENPDRMIKKERNRGTMYLADFKSLNTSISFSGLLYH